MEKINPKEIDADIPTAIKLLLFVLSIGMSTVGLFQGISMDAITEFFLLLLKSLLFIPGIFVLIGSIIKYYDHNFKLSNAYYLGLLMSIVLSYQALKATI